MSHKSRAGRREGAVMRFRSIIETGPQETRSRGATPREARERTLAAVRSLRFRPDHHVFSEAEAHATRPGIGGFADVRGPRSLLGRIPQGARGERCRDFPSSARERGRDARSRERRPRADDFPGTAKRARPRASMPRSTTGGLARFSFHRLKFSCRARKPGRDRARPTFPRTPATSPSCIRGTRPGARAGERRSSRPGNGRTAPSDRAAP